MSAPSPSSVRAVILEQHQALERTLDDVQQAASHLIATGHGQASLDRALALCRRLREHASEQIALEEGLLVPTLRDCDAWGQLRAAELMQKLHEQRCELSSLPVSDGCAMEPCALAERLVTVVENLRAAIDSEEQHMLSPELLRDDVYGIDVEDG
jgi:hypothetical protein